MKLLSLVLSLGLLAQAQVSTSTTYANRPAASLGGRLELTSDGYALYMDDGSALNAYGLFFPLTPPTAAATWTARNQGTATLTDDAGALHLAAPAIVGPQLRIWEKPIPAEPYTIETGFIPLLTQANYSWAGIVLVENSTGKVLQCTYDFSGSQAYEFHRWNSVTSFNGTYGGIASSSFSRPTWLKLVNDGTNLSCWASGNGGKNWFQIGSNAGKTAFLTGGASHYGIHVGIQNATYSAAATFLHLKVY